MNREFPRVTIRIALLAICIIAFIVGGVSLNGSESHEVHYATETPSKFCTKGLCLYQYRLKLGNTGRYPQNNIDISLARSWIDQAVIPLAVRNSGKVPRKYEKETLRNDYLISIGLLEPGKTVEISFALQLAPDQAAPSWDDILLQVSPAQGSAKIGDPQVTTFTRFLMSIARMI